MKNYTNKKSGHLTIKSFICRRDYKGKYVTSRYYWLSSCVCGNNVILEKTKIGTILHCGCLSRVEAVNKTHGETHTIFYRKWASMKTRTKNSHYFVYRMYKDINVSERWLSYKNFKEDMYESYLTHLAKYGQKDTTLDRIDSSGNYCLENCRWATRQIQSNNRCNIKQYQAFEKKQSISDWAREIGVSTQKLNDARIQMQKRHPGAAFEKVLQKLK